MIKKSLLGSLCVVATCSFVAAVSLSMSVHVAAADDKLSKPAEKVAVPKPTPKAEKVAAKKPPLAPEREAAALAFAQENHPELATLLQNLKQNAPKEYQAALVDLDRTADRLNKLKERSADRYETQLTDWKISSRIRLLAARLAMAEDPSVENELKIALRDRLEMRLNAQRADRDRVRARLEKLDQTIDEMSSKMDAQVEKQFSDLKAALPASKAAAKKLPKRPATATSVESKDSQK